MAEEEAKNVEPKKDLEVIYPNLATVKVGNIACKIHKLKFKQTISLLQIIYATFPTVDWSAFTKNPEQLATVLFLSVTKATGAFYNFLDDMLICDEENKDKLKRYIREELENDELLDVVQAVVDQERDNFAGWLKKVVGMLQVKELEKIIKK